MSIIKDFKTLFKNAPADSSQPSLPTKEAAATQKTSQKKVLIVEDETLLANALGDKFKRSGFDVIKAANGEIGLKMAEENNPDIILLDLMMPVMDGKTMLHRLREIPKFKNLPVIVLTNAGDVDNMRETKLYYSASMFLIKSNTSPDQLVAAAKQLV